MLVVAGGRRRPRWWSHGSRRLGSSSAPTSSPSGPWDETDDPVAIVADLLGGAVDRGDRRPHLGAFLVDLQGQLPATCAGGGPRRSWARSGR